MSFSLVQFGLAFVAFNAAILTWVFRTSADPFITTLQLTLPLLVWEVLLFASFAPDGLLDLFLPRVDDAVVYRFIHVDQGPGPHGDCWSDAPTALTRADVTEFTTSSDSSDSDDGLGGYVQWRRAQRT